jgi:hypothetical protein
MQPTDLAGIVHCRQCAFGAQVRSPKVLSVFNRKSQIFNAPQAHKSSIVNRMS